MQFSATHFYRSDSRKNGGNAHDYGRDRDGEVKGSSRIPPARNRIFENESRYNGRSRAENAVADGADDSLFAVCRKQQQAADGGDYYAAVEVKILAVAGPFIVGRVLIIFGFFVFKGTIDCGENRFVIFEIGKCDDVLFKGVRHQFFDKIAG